MTITVIGAGAIGCLVAGYLKLKGADVRLVAHGTAAGLIKDRGINISGVRGSRYAQLDVSERVTGRPNLVILATKTQDIESVFAENAGLLDGSQILTTQNGVQADAIVARHVPAERVISSIVMFGATSFFPGEVVHNFEGSWIMGRPFAANDRFVTEVGQALEAVFPTTVSQDLGGMKYLKVFVNASNCIPALLGASMQEAFADTDVSRIAVAIWREGLGVVKKAGVALASLPDFPLERLTGLVSLPLQEAAQVFSRIMTGLSKEPLYGSILQSIKRGRPTEIDYINGEFVSLAKKSSAQAPLNEKLVSMVHDVEKSGRYYSKNELLEATRGLVQ